MIAYLILILLGIVSSADAAGEGATPNIPKPQLPVTAQNVFYCPPMTALKKDPDKFTWSAPGGWQSFEMSFVDQITRFSGAQWRGTNVGQIFCVYRGDLETSFPVLLAYKVLAYEPQGGKWTANLGGYQNCESPNPKDCPFSIRLQPEQEDVYKQAEQLKRTAPPTSQPGF